MASQRRRLSLGTVEDFRRYVQKRLDHMEPGDIQRYQAHLLEERKMGVGTVINHVAALRFLYVKTLKRREMKQDLPVMMAWGSLTALTGLVHSANELYLARLLLGSAEAAFGCAIRANLVYTCQSCQVRRTAPGWGADDRD